MTEADSGVEVLRALAEVRHTLDRVASERERPDLSAARSIGMSEYAGGTVTVEVFFYLTDADDVETEWFAEARHTPGRTGWVVQRTVAVQKSVNGKVTNLGGNELPEVVCTDSSSLAAELPRLVEELLAVVPPSAG